MLRGVMAPTLVLRDSDELGRRCREPCFGAGTSPTTHLSTNSVNSFLSIAPLLSSSIALSMTSRTSLSSSMPSFLIACDSSSRSISPLLSISTSWNTPPALNITISISSSVSGPASLGRSGRIFSISTRIPLTASIFISIFLIRSFSDTILVSRSISSYLCWNFTPMMEMGRPRTKIPERPATHATNSPQLVRGVMSPYPMVVTLIILKYIDREIEVKSLSTWKGSGFSQKYIPLLIIMTAMTRRTARTDSSIRHVLKVVASTRTPWEYFPSLNTRPMMRNTRARRSARSTIALDDSSTRGTSMMPM
mmetsp:Transcript_21990/g.51144  ORF Transcript_21990/g.51144 Transcript_21990/m.51144 type:complete len:307 (-) Transcript_21990:390-1310(-)